MEDVTVVVGHRGGGQILGVFTDKKLVQTIQDMTKAFDQKGYVTFEKMKLNELQRKRFGLYFK